MSADNFPAAPSHPITVLLIDDQPIVGEKVRRMLSGQADIQFHFCSDPSQAIERANEIGPTVVLQDLVMPDIDGLMLVKFLRANPKTRDVPLIVLSSKEEPAVKAQAFAVGANDYLVKLPDRIELIARIRYHSRGYIALLERNEAYRLLAEEVSQAAKYVRSLLPAPLTTGSVRVDWRFVPSTQLGGDSFGYHWLDADRLALYLLDVSGHGVGASLLAVSAMNVLGSHSLPDTDFHDPGQVLASLNNAFPMEKQGGKYFTIWYGVYDQEARQLKYAGAGHPPALLLTGPDRGGAELKQLASEGLGIGIAEGLPYDAATVALGAYARLYLYSDGVYEIERPGKGLWKYDEFVEYLRGQQGDPSPMDRLLEQARGLHGGPTLADDFSMVQVDF